MSMKITDQGTKKFTQEEKLRILFEVKENGLKVTLAKYDLYPATYYYWKRKYESSGSEGLNHVNNRQYKAEIKQLSIENEALKILIAEKELESKLKDDLLKKKYPTLKKFSL